jgi:hypothetical protein
MGSTALTRCPSGWRPVLDLTAPVTVAVRWKKLMFDLP